MDEIPGICIKSPPFLFQFRTTVLHYTSDLHFNCDRLFVLTLYALRLKELGSPYISISWNFLDDALHQTSFYWSVSWCRRAGFIKGGAMLYIPTHDRSRSLDGTITGHPYCLRIFTESDCVLKSAFYLALQHKAAFRLFSSPLCHIYCVCVCVIILLSLPRPGSVVVSLPSTMMAMVMMLMMMLMVLGVVVYSDLKSVNNNSSFVISWSANNVTIRTPSPRHHHSSVLSRKSIYPCAMRATHTKGGGEATMLLAWDGWTGQAMVAVSS